MRMFQVGFGRSDITPHELGHRLMGYGNRAQGATGIHDRLLARALVFEDGDTRYALLANDLRCLDAESTREIREAVLVRTSIPPEHVFVAATHTHSGPHDRDTENWQRPLPDLVADAVEAAQQALQPARIGSGFGMLYGHSINRRWIDRPVDPAVAVVHFSTPIFI